MTDILETADVPVDLPYAHRGNLTIGPVGRHLVRLTLPMIWGIFAIISVQVVDTYFIGQIGTKELAAISFTFPVTMIVTHLLFGVNIAMASVISRLIGAGDRDDARRVVLHGLMMAVFVAGTMALTGYVFLDQIFELLGADQGSLEIIRDYMPVWFIASVFLSVPSAGNSAIRASGDAIIPALVMSIIAGVNLILDPILIFGMFGLPALGVKGAALATLAGYVCGLMPGFYFLAFKKELVCLDGLHFDKLGNSIKRLGMIALPAGITNIIMPATTAFVVSLLALYGAEVVAAYGIASRIESFTMVAVIGLATAMTPVIGQNWGAMKYDRVHKTINQAIGFNLIWSLVMAAVLAVFAKPIAGLFSDDPAVAKVTVLFFWIVPVSFALGNLVFGWASSFNAMGKPQWALLMIVVKSLALVVMALIFSKYWGATGIFCAIATVNVVVGTGCHMLGRMVCHKAEKKMAQT